MAKAGNPSALAASCWAAASAICVTAGSAANAQEASPPGATAAESLVITGTKSSPADRELTRQVEAALESDRFLDASRITVTTQDGVVRLEGVVSDVWDLLRVIRISNRIAGAKRVDRNLDMPDFDCGP